MLLQGNKLTVTVGTGHGPFCDISQLVKIRTIAWKLIFFKYIIHIKFTMFCTFRATAVHKQGLYDTLDFAFKAARTQAPKSVTGEQIEHY